jgi:ABC-type multidrug transport system fused ATPase/permease subunit
VLVPQALQEQMLQGVLSMNIAQMAQSVITLIGTVVILLIIQPFLTLVTFAIVPMVVWSGLYLGERLKKTSLGVMDQVAEATAIAEEAFSQVRVVQSFVQEDHERGKYGGRMDHAVQVAIRRAVTRALFASVNGFAVLSASVLVLWLGGRMVLEGTLTAEARAAGATSVEIRGVKVVNRGILRLKGLAKDLGFAVKEVGNDLITFVKGL